ncbi:MAG TPA: nicotinate-nucleotide--dimethylbenzimidazole phosphoribosyltransferase [Actinomycetota bacterium]|nr:nicotinate-nucleotide--dimethylbenzimidazole phosphoribosyltransferase [Actinomycetota bacterium]
MLKDLPGPDENSAAAVRERAAQVLRPLGALARLDEVAAWLASWQRTDRPKVAAPAAAIFVADHGVAERGVSAYPQAVTRGMLDALERGGATAAVLAREQGVALEVWDVGVGAPTNDFTVEPALSEDRFEQCLDWGRDAVAELDADLLILGEMGIGNTTAAAAVCATLFGLDAEFWTGRGTGVDDATYARKLAVVETASRRVPAGTSPLEILREVGGAEMVAMAGAAVEARRRSIPIVLDGFVVTAALAPLEITQPGALAHCISGHCSSEPGHRLLLEKLDLRPLLDLDLRLGEASGALLALPLVRLAAACVTDVATFQEWGLPGRL